jgi:alkylation response protein AidB-like acyl-CoA dehydrogenase
MNREHLLTQGLMAASEVDERVDQLLRDHDPRTTAPEKVWGAQYDLGLAWVHFPEGKGGLGVDPRLQERVDLRLQAAGGHTNMLRNFMGVGMAAPTLIAFGTEEQQEQLLRPIFTCEQIWCQMFSEPGAGSDVASLATRADRDGDEWVINGQKVWTTLAHVADWGLLLARSDPDQPKHKGLTYFFIDMHSPGVDVRPLRQLTGEAEFNEIFFTDVRVPDAQRLGERGEGWRVAISTLMNERVALERLTIETRGTGMIRHAVRLWQERLDKDPALKDRLMKVWIEAEVQRLTAMRAQQLRKQGTPGPEGSIGKLAVAELTHRIYNLCADIAGPASMLYSSYEMTRPTIMGEAALGDDDKFDMTKAFLSSLGTKIGGGTGDVMRNILGDRVLGLPAEPDATRDVPWNKVPHAGR